MLKPRVSSLRLRLRALPTLVWSMAGFMLSYLLFFLFPVFLTRSTMQFPPVLPTMSPIGADLREILTFVEAFLLRGGTPYIGTATYPPLSYVLLGPLLLLEPSQRYLVFSCITVVCYAVATFLFPLHLSRGNQVTPELLLVFATGLISYGLQFELERGQFNVIAVVLAYLGIWLYHSRKGQELWAYVLFTLSVQLKLYPLIFIVMFVRDWRDWKPNVRRLSLLIAANLALLFVLGWRSFRDFVTALREVTVRVDVISVYNHSIHSFVSLAATIAGSTGASWSAVRATTAEVELLTILAICLALIVVRAWRENSTGVNPQLLVACAVTALLVPAVSYDYTLAILAGPVALLLIDVRRRETQDKRGVPLGLATFLFCFAYSSTLLPLTFKSSTLILQSSLPALLVMVVADAFLALWLKPRSESAAEAAIGNECAASEFRDSSVTR